MDFPITRRFPTKLAALEAIKALTAKIKAASPDSRHDVYNAGHTHVEILTITQHALEDHPTTLDEREQFRRVIEQATKAAEAINADLDPDLRLRIRVATL